MSQYSVDRPVTLPVEAGHVRGAFSNVSWGSIFAGVALALAVQFLLNLLGVGIGAGVIDPGTGDNPSASALSIGGGLWFVFSGIIASFAGGYIASRLSGRPTRSTGGYHGLVSWAVTAIVVVYLLTTSAGSLIGGAFTGLASVAGGVGQTAATAASAAAPSIASSNDPMGQIEQQIRSTTGNDPQALQNVAVAAMQALVTGDEAQAETARSQAAEALARAQSIPVEQARTQVEQYEKSYRDNLETAKQRSIDAAEVAASALSAAAFLGFVSLIVGAIAAWVGGTIGAHRGLVRVED